MLNTKCLLKSVFNTGYILTFFNLFVPFDNLKYLNAGVTLMYDISAPIFPILGLYKIPPEKFSVF